MTRADEYAAELADVARTAGITVAVAESLTSGRLSATLGAAPESASWFRGGVVAYSAEVKHEVLGVPEVPVVSRTAAEAMARGVRALLEADVAVAVTGVGGPGEQDGEPAGSVWFAIATGTSVRAWHRQCDGGPTQVLDQTAECAVEHLLAATAGVGADRP